MRYVLLSGLLAACVSERDPAGVPGGETATDGSATGPLSTSGSLPQNTTTGVDDETTTSSSSAPADASSSSEESGSTGADACDPAGPITCGGDIYLCGDGEDNDRDGLTDLEDPDCLGPCDDDESWFGLGLPDIYKFCDRDCAFDGNGGMGDDGCFHDLRCDPLDAGNESGCMYTGGDGCSTDKGDPAQCVEACVPFTLNGCDCYGCCTLEVDGEARNVYLASPGCSTEDPEACPECTQQMETCGNPCDACEICFGETDTDCEQVECGDAAPCESSCDCEGDGYCIQGCCHPPARSY